jgi:hypothetical protein
VLLPTIAAAQEEYLAPIYNEVTIIKAANLMMLQQMYWVQWQQWLQAGLQTALIAAVVVFSGGRK